MRGVAFSQSVRELWRTLPLALVGALLMALAAPAQASDIYTWRTEDGATAFTDDPKAIPARYRDQVETRRAAALGGYERFSRQDSAVTDPYELRLAKRLERLRAINGNQGSAPFASRLRGEAPGYLTLNTGGRNAGGVDGESSWRRASSAGGSPC